MTDCWHNICTWQASHGCKSLASIFNTRGSEQGMNNINPWFSYSSDISLQESTYPIARVQLVTVTGHRKNIMWGYNQIWLCSPAGYKKSGILFYVQRHIKNMISWRTAFDTSVVFKYSSKMKYKCERIAYNLLDGAMAILQPKVLWSNRVFKQSLTHDSHCQVVLIVLDLCQAS